MDRPASAWLRLLGWTSRRFRTRPPPLRQIGRLAGRRVRRSVARRPVATPYRDRWVNRRTADLGDEMELAGFMGRNRLPDHIARRVRRGAWVVDAGANVGNITSPLCHLVGPTGRVGAIEPLPHNAARLEELKHHNGLDSLTVIPVALGASNGSATLRLPPPGRSGGASFSASWQEGGFLEVPVRTLDSLVSEAGVAGDLAILKIDVEGAEAAVLEGGRQTINSMRPLVCCEFNDMILRDANSSSADLLRICEDLGYVPLDPELAIPAKLAGRAV